MAKNRFSTRSIVLGGMFLALFFLASNVLPPFYLVPSVPVTLQVLVIALVGGMLGLRSGMLTILALFIATLAGLPMMSQFGGGPAVFARPTAGFIVGWVFVVLLSGLCRSLFSRGGPMSAVRGKKRAFYAVLLTAAMICGVLLDYLCGAVWLDVYNHAGRNALPSLFAANMLFLPFDIAKCVAASSLCTLFEFAPGLSRLLNHNLNYRQ